MGKELLNGDWTLTEMLVHNVHLADQVQMNKFWLSLEALAFPIGRVLLLHQGIVGLELSLHLVVEDVLFDELLEGVFRVHLVLFGCIDTPHHFLFAEFPFSHNVKDSH